MYNDRKSNKKKIIYNTVKKYAEEITLSIKNNDTEVYTDSASPCYWEEEEKKENMIIFKEQLEEIFEIYDGIKINQNDIKKILIENTKNNITKTFPPEIVQMILNNM